MSAATVRASRSLAWAPRSRRLGSRILITYIPLVILLIFLLAPFYWMIITSFKPDGELYNASISPLVVWQPTLDQFKQLFELTPYLEWAGNSILVSSLSTGIALLFGLPAGYAMARLRFRGSGAVGMAIFGTYLVPATLLFIPMYQIILSLGLLDTRWALVVVYPTFLTPFCTWLMSGYFKTIPKE